MGIRESALSDVGVVIPGEFTHGSVAALDQLTEVFGQHIEDLSINDVSAYAFYNGGDGKYIITVDEDFIQSIECVWKIPIEQWGATHDERVPTKVFNNIELPEQ